MTKDEIEIKMTKLRVGVSPLTNTIFAGKLNKDGTMWAGDKHDITDEAVMSVVQYIKQERVMYERGGKRYELKEVEITD